MNTSITINYANGEQRTLNADDNMEARILNGEMFSVSTMHPTEGEIAKMYAGNPLSALGYMLLLRLEYEKEDCPSFTLDAIDQCVKLLSNELTSLTTNHELTDGS
tara:strand:+ start:7260 stop:7574 length:315 start_codon:yes stop_codon:yes gene_type:complete